jgi:hypothetical protein
MEIVGLVLVGLVLAVVSAIAAIYSMFSRTDKLLTEIRDLLIEIRDKPMLNELSHKAFDRFLLIMTTHRRLLLQVMLWMLLGFALEATMLIALMMYTGHWH